MEVHTQHTVWEYEVFPSQYRDRCESRKTLTPVGRPEGLFFEILNLFGVQFVFIVIRGVCSTRLLGLLGLGGLLGLRSFGSLGAFGG